MSDRTFVGIGESEGISPFQIDTIGRVEEKVIGSIDLVVSKISTAPSDAFQPDQFPGRVSAKSLHQAALFEIMTMVKLSHFGQFPAANSTTKFAALHDFARLIETHSPKHSIAGHDHGLHHPP